MITYNHEKNNMIW